MSPRRKRRNRCAQSKTPRFNGRIENLERKDLFAADILQPGPIGNADPIDVIEFANQDPAGQAEPRQDRRNDNREPRSPASNPIRQQAPLDSGPTAPQDATAGDFAMIDGTEHNLASPSWGSVGQVLENWTTVEYADGLSEPTGQDRISAREVSNIVIASPGDVENSNGLSDLTWVFGQFIDHDIDLSESGDESFDIEVPAGDAWFDPTGTGNATISLNRTHYVESDDGVRQQFNEITSFIDGSVIYGSDQERADALRTFSNGLLATTEGDLLPFNVDGFGNAGGTGDSLFLAGDVRANENAALTAMHTVWVREHNRVASEIADDNPSLNDEEIYQLARQFVTAELQAITYNEFLPSLLGEDAISEYSGYDETVNPNIANIFSTAAYRFGHTMLSSELLRLNNDGTVADEGNIPLQNAFFNTAAISDNGIESILLGASVQTAQEVDPFLVDDVRNFLFGPPGAGGFDLASLNIQRGRDHGLADYNQVRVDMGLSAVTSFADISSDPEIQSRLAEAYEDVDSIDAWVGMLAEDHVGDSTLGVTATAIIAEQFARLRDGDRLYYENVFDGGQLRQLRGTSLADVIERNTSIEFDRGANVFFAGDAGISTDGSEPANLPPVDTRPVDTRPGNNLPPVAPQDPIAPPAPTNQPGDQLPGQQGNRDALPPIEPGGNQQTPVDNDVPNREPRLQRQPTPDGGAQNTPQNANELATDLAFANLGADLRP